MKERGFFVAETKNQRGKWINNIKWDTDLKHLRVGSEWDCAVQSDHNVLKLSGRVLRWGGEGTGVETVGILSLHRWCNTGRQSLTSITLGNFKSPTLLTQPVWWQTPTWMRSTRMRQHGNTTFLLRQWRCTFAFCFYSCPISEFRFIFGGEMTQLYICKYTD